MRHLRYLPLGLVGRIFAILLLAILIEFGVSTFFNQRASELSVRDDEARRLAEHLVISRKLLAEQSPAERLDLAEDLTTTRYTVGWGPELRPGLRIRPTLDRVHRQVLAWEPSLESANLRLRLTDVGRRAVIEGGLTLPDGSWMSFATREPVHELGFSWERVLWGLPAAVAIILIGGVLVAQTLKPMRQLARASERVGEGKPQAVPEGGPSEVRRVIAAFNRMQARIHRLIEDRTQALAAVSHDLRTPLARLRLRVDAIPETEMHDAIEADIDEMQAMIDSLLAYFGGEEEGEKPVAADLAVICATIADDAADHGRSVRYVGPLHLDCRLRPIAIRRALTNLVTNGLRYAEHVWITLDQVAGETVIRVEDDGPGIPEAELEKVLQPFIRLDHARARDTKGLGLGLAIVSRAIEAENGSFRLSNRAQGGLRAEIRLPGNKS